MLISRITCYNYSKLGYILKDCLEPKRYTNLKDIKEDKDLKEISLGNKYAQAKTSSQANLELIFQILT